MDTIRSIRYYVAKMVDSVEGLKVLLLDHETMSIVSMVYSQSEILEKEIFLIEMIDNKERRKMSHMRCLIFVRPTPENFNLIASELRDPKYGEYNLFFSNEVGREHLETLAYADECEVVSQVQEFYADYIAINREFFSLQFSSDYSTFDIFRNFLDPNNDNMSFDKAQSLVFDRMLGGCISLFLSMRRRPTTIRFQKSSSIARKLAEKITEQIDADHSRFHFSGEIAVLVLDRRVDPATPLLNQWTYQAMVHELIGIENGRLKISTSQSGQPPHSSSSSSSKPETAEEEFVLNSSTDPFFAENIFENFGDLCVNIKTKVDEVAEKGKVTENIQSIEDMKRFVETYPTLQKSASHVGRHLKIITEINRLQNAHHLMDISQKEQELACEDNFTKNFSELEDLLGRTDILDSDALRLALLFAMRCDSRTRSTQAQSMLTRIVDALYDRGMDRESIQLVSFINQWASSSVRDPELFGEKSVLSAKGILKKLSGGIFGEFGEIQNVFTQHVPLIKNLSTQFVTGKLRDSLYPSLMGSGGASGSNTPPPKEVFIFMIGGATFEEALHISQVNKQLANQNVHIVLGSTNVLNTSIYVEELAALSNRNKQQ